jgi:hypothetical protein
MHMQEIKEQENKLNIKNAKVMIMGGRRETYLQDSFTDKMDAPRLPITRPIFPGGTSRTERISSSGALSSMMRLSMRRRHS